MTREIALQKLKECEQNSDTESAHGIADSVLCELLEDLGYEDVIFAYSKVNRWYS